MASDTMKQIMAVFVLIVIALALTPAVASFTTDAGYQYITEVKTLDPSASNSTTLTYDARNDSATYAYFIITLNDTSAYGLTEIEEATNITYTAATDTLAFKTGVLTKTKIYNATINYQTDDLNSAVVVALLPIVPILWIVAVLAIGITLIAILLKRRG